MRIAGSVALCLSVATALGGCASLANAPPSCDGYARRPLNRSMWDWEAGRPVVAGAPRPAQTSTIEHPSPALQVAGLRPFDQTGSLRSCS